MKTRLISAVIAVLLVIGIYYYFQRRGLLGLCTFAAAVMIFEYSRLAFRRLDPPPHLAYTFIVLCAAIFGTAVFSPPTIALSVAAVASVLFSAMALLTVRAAEDLPSVMQTQALGLMGFFYTGIFPALATRLLIIDPGKGQIWLFGLMAIVFSGDTFAYLAGRTFGKNKLLEPVSPKKTVEGSIGGLLGSVAAGLIMGLFFLKNQPLPILLVTALVTGAFAQVGDLFESLIKRVAEVKDSGAIMPGHGGVLDRLDGLIFAAPVYFVLISFLV